VVRRSLDNLLVDYLSLGENPVLQVLVQGPKRELIDLPVPEESADLALDTVEAEESRHSARFELDQDIASGSKTLTKDGSEEGKFANPVPDAKFCHPLTVKDDLGRHPTSLPAEGSVLNLTGVSSPWPHSAIDRFVSRPKRQGRDDPGWRGNPAAG
jgi:hypothetical protein